MFFKRNDTGFCPSYITDKYIYWIQDAKIRRFNGGGEYEYYLMCRRRERIEKIGFKWRSFEKLIKKLKLKKIEGGIPSVYNDGKKEYLYNRKEDRLVVIYDAKIIAGAFSNYRSCFEYSEEYIKNKYFKETEQLNLFELEVKL